MRIENFVEFQHPVQFRSAEGYLEAGAPPKGKLTGLYFRAGVRLIDEATFLKICDLGEPA
jgi:hypothetical protein